MMDPNLVDEVSIADLFDQFIDATTMRNVLSIHHRILNYSDLSPCDFNVFFPKLKRVVMTNRVRKNWRAKALFSKIDKKAAHRCYSNTKTPTPVGNQRLNCDIRQQELLDDSVSSQQSANGSRTCYNNNALQHYNCLVIGSGPAGLRTAIELQLLGASRVVVVEKRSRFSRNNVLHLWPFVIDDLKSLGAKKFYGKFCAGSIDHISIRQLQLILLKICLMIGCDFRESCSFLYLCPANIKQPTKQQEQVQAVETNGDSNKEISSSDSKDLFDYSSKCDLDATETNKIQDAISDSFIKVAEFLQTEGAKDESIINKINDNLLENKENRNNESKTQVADSAIDDNSPRDQPSENQNNSITIESSIEHKSNYDRIERAKGDTLRGSQAHFQCDFPAQEKELHSYKWDVIIGADGRQSTLSKFFPLKEFRGRLAIAITANFINRQTPAEASVSEISGLSFIYNQEMFNALAFDTNILLENICYYKDDTHYFVMTAKKKSLLERGVLINDYAATHDLLSKDNVNRQALLKYAKDAAFWTTGLEPLDFALNHYGQEDCAMFDFTSMYAATNACKALCTREGGLTLVSLVGDSLLEPFWPTGSGCARGFLSSFDAAWMCRQWAVNKCAVVEHHNPTSSRLNRNLNQTFATTGDGETLKTEYPTFNKLALSVIAERESIYRILAQTTSENLQQNYSHWTLNPHSRYPNLNRHLVTPSQIEHLVTDNGISGSFIKFGDRASVKQELNVKTNMTEPRGRRIKSPNHNNSSLRKSPKKLKSADASPVSRPRNAKGRSLNPLSRNGFKSMSRNDVAFDETYVEFEKSYNNLADDEKAPPYYLNHRTAEDVSYDDFLSNPSISGIMPSSNNLLSLEARRARDIDECLKQRRQKNQLGVVRDQLLTQFRRDGSETAGCKNRINNNGNPSLSIPGGAALFNELRRIKEQQAKGRENHIRFGKDAGGPLTLLNSIRRCTSFAERVKSFESKLSSQTSQESSVASTPRTPIDDVKNLPQFATLQELFVNNSASNKDIGIKKSKIPIMKLSKDDWNVKCWEKRLAAFEQNSRNFKGSTKSLNKAFSTDTYHATERPEKQLEVFRDRIKEMADKLKKAKDPNKQTNGVEKMIKDNNQQQQQQQKPAQGWVSHIRRKLIHGTDIKNPQFLAKQHMNPAAPSRQIKKLFADDDDEDDHLNKHYDHLCVNRPINKYLSKNAYTSHLTRVRYNSSSSKVINRASPSAASKQAYMAAQDYIKSSSSIGSRPSRSDNQETSESTRQSQLTDEITCIRCKTQVSTSGGISIGGSALHKHCLRCTDCGITLRTNEIQHYLSLLNEGDGTSHKTAEFLCAICKPNIREDLAREAARLLGTISSRRNAEHESRQLEAANVRMKSREEFLSERIDYNEIYKNILDDNMSMNDAVSSRIERIRMSSSRETTPTAATESSVGKNSSSSLEYDDARSRFGNPGSSLSCGSQGQVKLSPSPITITLPLELYNDKDDNLAQKGENEFGNPRRSSSREPGGFRIARSETIDGSEQVTLILPSIVTDRSSAGNNGRQMIDEEELERIHHLDNNSTLNDRRSTSVSRTRANKLASTEKSNGEETDENDEERSDDTSDESKDYEQVAELSDDPSSLNSPPNTEDYRDDDDEDGENELDRNSTYEDFLTSEEFGALSDGEETEANVSAGRGSLEVKD